MEILRAVSLLKNGGIGILPTDTIYGLVGRALSRDAVERIYQARHRSSNKPLIILISCLNDLNLFGISSESREVKLACRFWPGKVSIIFPCDKPEFEYVHRGTGTLAFRLPNASSLLKILSQTGPLVAPSANIEGCPPALILSEARNYFGDSVDFYIDGGRMKNEPSSLIKIEGNKISIIREDAVKILQ